MQIRLISCVVVAVLGLSGCTNAILGTLLAPEAVVTGAASSLAEAGARNLSGASLDQLSDLNGTVNELNRIIKDNPNAANADRLRTLRDSLANKSRENADPNQINAAQEPPQPRRLTDTKMPVRGGDRLLVVPPNEHQQPRRSNGRPETLPTASSLAPETQPVHAMSFEPVRLQN